MNPTFKQLIGILGGWSIIVVGISSWGGRILAERLFSKWRRNEQVELENSRSVLANDRLLLESAVKSLQAGHNLNHEKRLVALEHLWASVLFLREKFSPALFFYGILLPDEYDESLRKSGGIALSVANLDDAYITDAMQKAQGIESDRPYLGETLWSRFFIYRAFLGRLAMFISNGKKDGHVKNWREDKYSREMLGHVMPSDMHKALFEKPIDITAVYRAVNFLESLMLEEISLIVSGRRSAFESFENARDLRKSLANIVEVPGR